MKSKKGLVITISVILFLAVLLLGANTVFSVAQIEIAYNVSSAQAYNDARTLQRELEEEYLDDNILFVGSESVVSRFDAYPYLTVKSFKKVYPDKLMLQVEEKTEKYAISLEENGNTVYYMIDSQGEVLRNSDQNVNNVDGGKNFLIEGLRHFESGGFSSDGNFGLVMRMCAKMEELTGDVRSCFTSMQLITDATGTEVTVNTHEGVIIRIGNPEVLTDEKINAAVDMYLRLDDKDKLYGYISVLDDIAHEGLLVGPTYIPRS